MTLLKRARGARERMDEPDVDRGDLEAALQHVAAVNRWLGGRRALLRHLPDALPDRRTGGDGPTARVLDVGTGSADLPLALVDWADRRDRDLEVTAVDLHAATLAVAHDCTAAEPRIRVLRADGLQLPFPTGTFDTALLSMTLHHMDGPALVGIMEELGRVARGGRVLVGELERAVPNYLGARLMAATLWRTNPVTRNDGPLSVRRAFTPAELLDLAHQAGLRQPHVQRHFFYRLVLGAGA